MRGRVNRQSALFYAINIEQLVPSDHPLRAIKIMADEELARLSKRIDGMYSSTGRPSTPPEMIIKAKLLEALYSIRSERQFCEQIAYNFLFRWFIGLKPDADVWDHSTFTKSRETIQGSGLLRAFFDGTVAKAIAMNATNNEHFSVDGTLIQSMASMKSFQPKRDDDDPTTPPSSDSNAWQDFKGEKRGNATHQSTTDPEARLYRKGGGREALLYHSMHGLMDNRAAILMDIDVEEANGRSERECAEKMVRRMAKRHRIKPATIGMDAGYRDHKFRARIESMNIEAHVAKDAEKADCPRHRASQISRRGIEKIFAWLKETAGMRRSRVAKRWKIKLHALAAGAAYNLLRLANLARQRWEHPDLSAAGGTHLLAA